MVTVDECIRRKNEQNIQTQCDDVMNTYCKSNPNEISVCGCSLNAFQQNTDPQLATANPICWAKSCNTNSDAYMFTHNLNMKGKCPDICIDKSTITSIGNNIYDSKFIQSGCKGNISILDSSPPPQNNNIILNVGSFLSSLTIVLILVVVAISLFISVI